MDLCNGSREEPGLWESLFPSFFPLPLAAKRAAEEARSRPSRYLAIAEGLRRGAPTSILCTPGRARRGPLYTELFCRSSQDEQIPQTGCPLGGWTIAGTAGRCSPTSAPACVRAPPQSTSRPATRSVLGHGAGRGWRTRCGSRPVPGFGAARHVRRGAGGGRPLIARKRGWALASADQALGTLADLRHLTRAQPSPTAPIPAKPPSDPIKPIKRTRRSAGGPPATPGPRPGSAATGRAPPRPAGPGRSPRRRCPPAAASHASRTPGPPSRAPARSA